MKFLIKSLYFFTNKGGEQLSNELSLGIAQETIGRLTALFIKSFH